MWRKKWALRYNPLNIGKLMTLKKVGLQIQRKNYPQITRLSHGVVIYVKPEYDKGGTMHTLAFT